MKRKSYFITALCLCVMLLGVLVTARPRFSEQLLLSIQTDKQSFTLGEVIPLRILITNESNGTISVPTGIDVMTGLMEVLLSKDNIEYKKYLGPRWGTKDTLRKKVNSDLAPGQRIETSATVLFNNALQTEHLNKTTAEQLKRMSNQIESHTAIAKSGTYWIKARFRSTDGEFVESFPLEITISEPSGAGLRIWTEISKNPEIAYFLQTGFPRFPISHPKSQQLMSTLQQLTEELSSTDSQAVQQIQEKLRNLRSQTNRQQ